MNHYYAFIKAIETGSFTKAAEELGYTQSAISQMIHSLEEELSTTLIIRSRTGITLTPDGEEFLPYIKKICNSHRELREKLKEMEGIHSGLIRIGTFTSVSCHWLPELFRDFKEQYPSVHFELHQGDYTEIANWIKEGSVDFGFVNPKAVSNLTTSSLQEDEMLAVLPTNHPLATHNKVSLKELSKEPYILLDEGEISEPLTIFRQNNFEPNIQYRVHDDYAIMSMIEQGLGISILPKLVLSRCPYNIVTKSISPSVVRTISLAYKDKRVLPIASRYFIDFIIEKFRNPL
ncbi:LysR family transcriptional regulator [Bacillus sp. ISL-40]|uniref:LysR family transcriptional regulator n=1 Tax=unclassified Bacillus (in: firmicutes) TaxID=185979 RepID=UPI001BEC46B6|nr:MULTISPECIES: LysR family transcriptional regulator [unclassified Bacillus (in: firmicutes)]MBT2700324.1 LysR family transcriptional regulator [Bacillus sp. ISL-40]MBT2725136.1 LysR family transcriptional regulator [Bacillus sp. ISL-46]MBT2742824.1 LysR family transcriptional regulator [Bacillus sp. ISL-77]